MTSRATGKVRGGGCGVELLLAFPFGCWGIYGRRRGGRTFFFAFRFAFSFALSFTLSFFALTFTFVCWFTFAFTFAFGNVRVDRIEVSNIAVIHREEWVRCWVDSNPWRTEGSSAGGSYRCNTSLLYPRGMTVGYECWKKGIRVPSRGATTRSGVRYRYFNMRERGECSGNRVGDGGVGRVRRRDRDTWRVRERRGRLGMW